MCFDWFLSNFNIQCTGIRRRFALGNLEGDPEEENEIISEIIIRILLCSCKTRRIELNNADIRTMRIADMVLRKEMFIEELVFVTPKLDEKQR